jgi:dTDP-4-dehydrorhamnose reductase
MRFAVLGAGGQLGRDLCHYLDGEVVALTRQSADLTRPETLRRTLDEARPDVVINCAAYNLVDRAETEPDAAFAVNTWGARSLALYCGERGTTLVHFSSDYVFGLDSTRRIPWAETDLPGPVNVYGVSKLAGEYLVRSLCPRHFVVRTCGLYGLSGHGGKGGNFVETMLRVASQGKPLRIVADQTCTPTSTADLAKALGPLLATERPGLYHLTNAGSCTWFEFARAIFELAHIPAEPTPITSREYGAPARRPSYSVLASPAGDALGLPRLRPWQESLAAYLQERKGARRV